MKISDVKPYPRNAKEHPKKQIDLLAKVVKEVGWRQNVEVNQQGIIIAGHGRWLVWEAYKNDPKMPPIWIMDDKGNTIHGSHDERPLTLEQEKMWRLADNQLNAMTGFNMELVIPELKGMSLDFLDLTGFDRDLIIEPDAQDDIIPENVPNRSKMGDLYELGAHRVLCGDSTQTEAVLRLCGGKKADMAFTDPPYNVDYEGYTDKKLKIKNDKKTTDEFNANLFLWFKSFKEAIKAGGSMYVCYPSRFHREFQNAIEANLFEIRNQIIWAKNTFAWGMGRYKYQHEPILFCYTKGKTDAWYGDKTQSTLWNVNKPSKSEEHPTMKPVELITKALVNSSKEEDIILDLFLGSGSTLIASEKANRICYGMELDPHYVDVIVQRYCDYTENYDIICNNKSIKWEEKQKDKKLMKK